MTGTCDMCGDQRLVRWFLMDQNGEVLLCVKCRRELKRECDLEKIPDR